jgi:hypothetical protein
MEMPKMVPADLIPIGARALLPPIARAQRKHNSQLKPAESIRYNKSRVSDLFRKRVPHLRGSSDASPLWQRLLVPRPRPIYKPLLLNHTKSTDRKLKSNTCLAVIAACMLYSSCDSTSAQPDTRPATQGDAKSARAIRGASPYEDIRDEPAPQLIVDPPLSNLLAQGVVWIQWRAENVHIAPVFGDKALDVSPRLGHLHVQVDDLPWWWADPSNVNTIDMAGMPPGPHKVKITLVNTNHEAYPGQSKLIRFTIPEGAKSAQQH